MIGLLDSGVHITEISIGTAFRHKIDFDSFEFGGEIRTLFFNGYDTLTFMRSNDNKNVDDSFLAMWAHEVYSSELNL